MVDDLHATSWRREAVEALSLDRGGPRKAPSAGEPVESFARLFADQDAKVGVWECTPGVFPVARDGSTSVMLILQGAGLVRDSDGREHVIEPGAVLVEPDGWSGQWQVDATVRKFYVVVET